MEDIKRRAGYYVLSAGVIVLVSAIAYDFGMRTFEPRPYPPPDVEIGFLHSLQVVVETFTATGYGSDSPWYSTEMNILVMLLDLTGVGLFFLALPAVFLPLFRDALSESPPTTLETTLEEHVVICTYSQRAETLISELRSNDVEYVLVEPDGDRAVALEKDGHLVVHADPESIAGLKRAGLEDADALVADVSDKVDASIVLAAREISESIRIISVVEDPDYAVYHELAGADEVVTPRQLLGAGLSQKVTSVIDTDLTDDVGLTDVFDIAELPVHRKSSLVGQTIAESDLGNTYGVNIIGIWRDGEFQPAPRPETPLEDGTILLVTGSEAQLRRLRTATISTRRQFRTGRTVVLGYGEVGRAVDRALEREEEPCTVVDINDIEGVDIVGDATDRAVLKNAGVPSADSVVLAIPDPTVAEFATLIIRDLSQTVEIIARAESKEGVQKLYRAGADYVLSIASVSGRAIATKLIESEEILSLGTNVRIIRTTAPSLAGRTLADARIRKRTACTVIGVERNGETLVELAASFRFELDDTVIVAGTDEGTNRFVELFC
ncbi:potassium channel family protein [Halalkalirubrum salinum]|uniref:potassium channel family protein n=1 Tax=Halalkalirubrum salinum TaxID=2563889 RepID=UPI0010FAE7C5|nr:TrkA family potassium uptake protein [Halalkalirubrum salinum]